MKNFEIVITKTITEKRVITVSAFSVEESKSKVQGLIDYSYDFDATYEKLPEWNVDPFSIEYTIRDNS